MTLTHPPLSGREYFQARSGLGLCSRSQVLADRGGPVPCTEHTWYPWYSLATQSSSGDRVLNKKTSVTESSTPVYEPGSMSMALCLLWHLPAPAVTEFSSKATQWPPAPAPSYRVLLQGLCQQHVPKNGPAVLGHLCLLLGPRRDQAGVKRKATAQIQSVA